jgi:hypothetical protein
LCLPQIVGHVLLLDCLSCCIRNEQSCHKGKSIMSQEQRDK